MGMVYDKDLLFMADFTDRETLWELRKFLTWDPNDGRKRIMSNLDENIEKNSNPYWQYIAEELQRYGGNSIANAWRGHGVPYREVLEDCMKKLKIPFIEGENIESMETKYMMHFVMMYIKNMNESQLHELAMSLELQDLDNFSSTYYTNPSLWYDIITIIFRRGGFKSYQMTLHIINYVWKMIFGKGLTIGTNAMITKVLGVITGPVGWTVSAALTAKDIADPAMRVTIPACILVAQARIIHKDNFPEKYQEVEVNTSGMLSGSIVKFVGLF